MRIVLILGSLAIVGAGGYSLGVIRSREAVAPALSPSGEHEELRRMHDEDQADRSGPGPVDWTRVSRRDEARRARVKTLFVEGRLSTGADYYHAAMILQHSNAAEDFLLAHELCVAAIIKGKNDRETRWLAASAEDRFLTNIGRPQRFATQFRKEANSPWRLDPVDATVTDELRAVMGVRSLAEAKAHEVELNKAR